MAVTPTHGDFRHSELDTVASSARRIFLCVLCEGVVQERSKTRIKTNMDRSAPSDTPSETHQKFDFWTPS